MSQRINTDTMRRKLVIVGDGACGKTSLLCVFTLGTFPDHYIPTVFENYVADCLVDGKSVELALWDTAGQEDYERLRPLAYSRAHVILVAFAIDKPESFNNVEIKWLPEIKERSPDVPVLLIGLKKDLRNNDAAQSGMREAGIDVVNPREGINLARKIKAKRYLECSALTGEGVDDVFEAAARTALLISEQKGSNKKCILM